MAKKQLYLSISAHGFGHIGQMTPILNKLASQYSNQIRFIIQSGAERKLLQQFFYFEFEHIHRADDMGMLMANSLDVQAEPTHQAYLEFHDNWAQRLEEKTREIAAYNPDAVLSNIAYLTLAAGKALNLPTLALCSLNWAEIYQSYCGHLPDSEAIFQAILSHYQVADHFLIPAPGMAMPALHNQRRIGPLSRFYNRFPGFRKSLGLAENSKLILVSMGGIPHPGSQRNWPMLDNVIWIDASNTCTSRQDIWPLNQLNYGFLDILGHCDLLICKPGYGLFAEASCNQVPIIYVKRERWPEEPFLVAWLQANNYCLQISREQFDQGDMLNEIQQLLEPTHKPQQNPPAATGVGEACGYILEALELN